MNDSSPADRLRNNATGVASTLVTGIWLGAMFTGQDWWLAALLVGYIVVVPVVALLYGDSSDIEEWWDTDELSELPEEQGTNSGSESSDETPLETLRRRYAEGELTEAQFERKLERLLETETLEDVEDRARGDRTDVAVDTETSRSG